MPAQEADVDRARVLDQEHDEQDEDDGRHDQPDVQASDPRRPTRRGVSRGRPPRCGWRRCRWRRCRWRCGGRRCCPRPRRSERRAPEDAHPSDCLSQRRQVDIARVTRRSHPGHVAEISRLASDQNTNVEAGIDARQYTHVTLSRSLTGVRGPGVVPAGAKTSRKSTELLIVRRLSSAKSRGGENAQGPDEVQPRRYCQCRTRPARKTGRRDSRERRPDLQRRVGSSPPVTTDLATSVSFRLWLRACARKASNATSIVRLLRSAKMPFACSMVIRLLKAP
ncbi:MAG: hypothetical protein QOD07_3032 [Frankiaceae bacterium]|nr:hypothetical protein [Frankiaceae bacterium]